MQKHTAKINTMASTTLHPYADPFVNIYELEPKTLRMVTNELFHDEWKLKLESSTKADTYTDLLKITWDLNHTLCMSIEKNG